MGHHNVFKIKFIYSVFSVAVAISPANAQFKYSAGLGLAATFPDYSQFNNSIGDSLDKIGSGWFPLGYDISIQIYPSVRLGYFKLSNALLPKKSSEDFILSMVMRGVSIQTFFTFLRRFEANFGIVPLLGQADFSQKDITATTTHFQFPTTTKAGTRNSTFGFYSWTGLRYYLSSFLAVEAHMGYLRCKFKGNKWKGNGQGVGVSGKIDLSKPLFRFGVVFGW